MIPIFINVIFVLGAKLYKNAEILKVMAKKQFVMAVP